MITEQKIRHSMDDVLGCKSNYTCPEQQQLIQFAVNERYKHSIGNLACGMGKSMAIWVHVMARYNYSTIDGTILVIMPDRSLMEQQFCKATDIFSGKDVSIGRYYQNDIVGSDDLDILKHQIAFVSINAWQKISVDCGDVLKKWQEDRPIDLIFVDEIHLLYDQYEIRANEFNSLQNLVDLGAPVILLTATLPKALSIPLVKFLRLGSDVEYIGGDSYDAPDVEINVASVKQKEVVQDAFAKICERIKTIPGDSIHAISQHKHEGKSLYEKCKQKGILCEYIDSDTDRAEHNRIARSWFEGKMTVRLEMAYMYMYFCVSDILRPTFDFLFFRATRHLIFLLPPL